LHILNALYLLFLFIFLLIDFENDCLFLELLLLVIYQILVHDLTLTKQFIIFLIRLLLILNDVLDLWLNHVLPFLNLRLLMRFLILVWYLGNRGLLAMNGGQELLSLVQ
jgi:hypothetical protein